MASYIGSSPVRQSRIDNESINVDMLNPAGASAGQVFVINSAGNDWILGSSSSAEIYGFTMTDANSDGVIDSLSVTTTNQGADNISVTTYDAFDEKFFAASGFTFSINSSGHLIATI